MAEPVGASAPAILSVLDHFGPPTPKRKATDHPPPPWPLSPDPRTPECLHDWDGTWGVIGERQRQCKHCERWIWDHSINTRCNTWECFEPPVKGSDLCTGHLAEAALELHLEGECSALCEEHGLHD